MKNLFIFIFILFTTKNHSQQFNYQKLLPPSSKEHSDLAFLEDELINVDVVMLGEMTHSYGNIFEMKTRVIEYLHEQLGFNTIAMEASIYDIWKLNKEGYNSDGFKNNIFEVWSKSEEFKRLVKYIEENNIKVIGFDSQFNNDIPGFIEEYLFKLEQINFKLTIEEDDFAIQLDNVLERLVYDDEVVGFKSFIKQLDKIIAGFQKLPQNDDNYYWIQFSKSIIACANDAYYNEDIKTLYYATKDCNYRDRQMADNLLSYFRRYPKEKVICWADNVHIINDMSDIKQPVIKDFFSMGTYVKSVLKEKMYSIATLHSNDSVRDPFGWHKIHIEKNSLEDYLKKTGNQYVFFKANQNFIKEKIKSRILNFMNFDYVSHDKLYDAYIYLEKANLSTYMMSQFSDSIKTFVKNNQDLQWKNEIIKEKKNNILRSNSKIQFLNSQTLKEIPFVSIYFEKENVLKESDENGFISFDFDSRISKNSIATISCLGFFSLKLSINNFNSKIYLTPKQNNLKEVIVIGNLTTKQILKKVLKKLKDNHPQKSFNFHRFSKIDVHKNSESTYKFDLVSKDYDMGYFSPYINTNFMEEIKWYVKPNEDKLKENGNFFSYRENAIQYASFFNKRKIKKFEFNLEGSLKYKDVDVYVVRFKCLKSNWSYTNKIYPTYYYGQIYINKDNFAVIKVEENWEALLTNFEIKKYFKDSKSLENTVEMIIREKNTCEFLNIFNNKYFASEFSNSKYKESLNKDGIKENSLIEITSEMYDFQFSNVEEINHINSWKQKLSDVEYNQNFWENFKIRE